MATVSARGESTTVPAGALLVLLPEATGRDGVRRVVSRLSRERPDVRLLEGDDERALPWLREGRAVVDPAGHAIEQLLAGTEAAVLPAVVTGKDGAGEVRIGAPIAWSRLSRLRDAGEAQAWVRARAAALTVIAEPSAAGAAPPEPIADAEPVPCLVREIDGLPAGQLLLERGPIAVHLARAAQAPALLREIGRLRETAFREVGEGTGRARDLDRFDQHYLHLFAWDRDCQRVVGAYRIGLTDELLRGAGPDALYTSTLFDFDPLFFRQVEPALELGRSWVRAECQGTHSPLALLWQGIGRFLAARPRYRMLFGPVSISHSFSPVSRELIEGFLRARRFRSDLARLVAARNPPRPGLAPAGDAGRTGAALHDLGALDELVSEIEPDGKGLPLLLRHYLRLGGELLGFNVNPDFGACLDGLVLVDLWRLNPAVLARYMGKDGAARYLRGPGGS